MARLLGGSRYPANSGGRVDVEAPGIMAQVKHVQRLSLARLEALALEIAELGRQRGKAGLVVVKRRAGRGQLTPRLVLMTEAAWRRLAPVCRQAEGGPSQRRGAKQTGVLQKADHGGTG